MVFHLMEYHELLLNKNNSVSIFLHRFLNNAEIAPYVPGANYTFFVPVDVAFHKRGLNRLSDEQMSSETALKFLLNHFIKGRLYDRNLKHDEVFESIGGTGLKIQRLATGKYMKFDCLIFFHKLYKYMYINDILFYRQAT